MNLKISTTSHPQQIERLNCTQQGVLRKWGGRKKHQQLCCYHQQSGQTVSSAKEQIINFFILHSADGSGRREF